MTIEERREKSQILSDHILELLNNSLAIHKIAIVGGFAPLRDEPLWYVSLGNWKKQLAFPKTKGLGMDFFLTGLEDLLPSWDLGIKMLVPPKDAPKAVPDLLLIPGLAYGKEGARLGRGRGFFDRYLKEFNGIKVGVCFEMQLMEVPSCSHDQSVDFLVTEREIIDTTAKR